jgi:hypothetical protein
MLLLLWLTSTPFVPFMQPKASCEGICDFYGVLYSHGLWLQRKCARHVYKSGLTFLRGYKQLAALCEEMNIRGFKLRPKLHSFHHILFDLSDGLQSQAPLILSPMAFNCEANEDFIGRVSRLSRRVSQRLVSKRTLQLYSVTAKTVIRKHFKTRG